MRQRTMILMMAGLLLTGAGAGWAADQERTQQQDQMKMQDQEPIYGSQMMTPQERSEYQAKMRAATTQEERERIRSEHHEQMKARAAGQGITLPDEPPSRGMGGSGGGGMGPGGGGMGPGGGGMGPGGGGMGPGGGGKGGNRR